MSRKQKKEMQEVEQCWRRPELGDPLLLVMSQLGGHSIAWGLGMIRWVPAQARQQPQQPGDLI